MRRNPFIQKVEVRLLVLWLATSLFCWALPGATQADAGDLDLSFNGGKVTTDFFGHFDQVSQLAIQSDGRIVAAGYTRTSDTNEDFALARYNSDGSLDGTFGSGGKTTTDFFGSFDRANAVAIQSDGKIVAAGFISDDSAFLNFGIARYNSDGTLDNTFGTNGKVFTGFSNYHAAANALTIQADGKIVLAGSISPPAKALHRFALARYNNDGSLDNAFGDQGRVTTSFFKETDTVDNFDQAFSIAIQSDNRIVASGVTEPPHQFSDFGLIRYNPDGSLDTTFGKKGKVTTDFFGSTDFSRAVMIQEDGKIIAAGIGFNTSTNSAGFVLARYNSDGSLDGSFGNNGKTASDFSGRSGGALAMALQPDRKILAVGEMTDIAGRSVFALVRYTSSGNLDSSFGSGGKVITAFFDNVDDALTVGIQPDGRIVAAGFATHNPTNSDFALARYESGIVVPTITGASVSGKSLIVTGSNFDKGAKILLNRQVEKTRNDDQSPASILIAKKAGKRIHAGAKLLVQNSDGVLSQEFTFPVLQ